MLSVKSMIELRKLHSNKDGEVINLLGYKEGGVSGGGFFIGTKETLKLMMVDVQSKLMISKSVAGSENLQTT